MSFQFSCPSCGKTIDTAPLCPRCSCDCRLLVNARLAVNGLSEQAEEHLQRNDYRGALKITGKCFEIAHGSRAARIAALACLAQKDFSSALSWREKAIRENGKPV